MTDEQRQASVEQRKQEQKYAQDNLKIEYADKGLWQELASKYGSKLPLYWKPISELKYMRRVAKKANYDINLFVQATGFSNLKEFTQANSNLTAVAGVGLLLEEIDDYFTKNHKYPEKIEEKSKKKAS
jgi:hypothetical protein